MRISHFFIDRPIFAAVLSIVFVILGGVAFFRLPVAQYPEIAPPTITVSGQYPGASADVVAATVVTPIEQQINGVENMIYMSSNSTADGRFSIAVSFELGTNLDIAQVQVQNRVAIAQPRLPVDVRNIGVTVTKSSPDLLMVVHLYSPDKSRDSLFISHYATLAVTDTVTRVDGVGSITVFGRNNDPTQTMVFALTGDPNTQQVIGNRFGLPGVGLLRSLDGGKTWVILDSVQNVTDPANPQSPILPFLDPARDHTFFNAVGYKIIADPSPGPTGEAVLYMALSMNGIPQTNQAQGCARHFHAAFQRLFYVLEIIKPRRAEQVYDEMGAGVAMSISFDEVVFPVVVRYVRGLTMIFLLGGA